MSILLAATLFLAPQSSVWGQSAEASRAYERALGHFEARELEETILELKTALEQDPDLLAAHVLVARVYLYIQEPGAAEDSLIRARRLGADPDITWPLRAEALYGQGKFEQLLALTPESGLSILPQSTVLLYRGRALMDKGDFLRAAGQFTKARDLTPTDPKPHVYLAMLALRAGDLPTAQERVGKAVQVAPDAADVWSVKGDLLHNQGKLNDAVAAYGEALERDPEHYDARLSRAGVLLDLKLFGPATVDVQQLRESRPLDPRAAYLEAVLLSKTNQLPAAREALQRAASLLEEMGVLALDRSMQLVLLAGLANFELGKYEQAQGHLSRYVDRFPQQPGPRKLLGTVLLRNGRTAEAINMLEPALPVTPNDHKLLLLLGKAYMQTGRYDIATGYLKKAHKLSGGTPEARSRLALSRIGGGDETRGLQELSDLFSEDPRAHQSVGLTLATLELKRRRFKRTAEIAETILRFDEDNLVVRNILGAARMGMDDFDTARSTFEGVLTLDESFLPARINLGKLEVLAGNPDAAREHLMRSLELRPESVTAMVELGRVDQRSGRTAEALRWLQKAQTTAPSSIPVALALVEILLSTGDTKEAARIVGDMQGREPDNVDVLAALARVHQASGRNDQALNVFKQIVRTAGFDTVVLHRVARLQLAAGSPGDAMYSLDKALKTNSGHLPSRLLLAQLLIQAGRLDDALAASQGLLETHPELAASHRLAGDLSMVKDSVPAAVEHFRRALELSPAPQNALRVYGATIAAGESEKARAFLQAWVKAHPNDQASARALAENHLAAGRLALARSAFEGIIKANPRDAGALNNLAYVLDRQKDPSAVDIAARAVSAAPNDPLALDTLGWILVRQGKTEEGLRRLRDAHSRASSNPEIRYHIAAALVSLKRTAEARRELQSALRSPVPFEGIDDARKLLAEIDRK